MAEIERNPPMARAPPLSATHPAGDGSPSSNPPLITRLVDSGAPAGIRSKVRPSTSRTPVAPSRPTDMIASCVPGGTGMRFARCIQRGPNDRVHGPISPRLRARSSSPRKSIKQARLLAEPLALRDLVEADPQADDDRLGRAAVDAEGAAQPRGAARLARLEPEVVRADDPPLVDELDVAGVVPAVGDAVAVGVNLEVLQLGRVGPHDEVVLRVQRRRQGQAEGQGAHGGLGHGFSSPLAFLRASAASRWARPVMGTNSVGRSSSRESLPSRLVTR